MDARPTAEALITGLHLQPHPEGGFYRETYRSADTLPAHALPPRFAGARAASTSILFLLRAGDVSHFHVLRQDEIWHFHLGGPLELFELHPDGRLERTVLGPDVTRGQHVQHVFRAGVAFAAAPLPGTDYTLVGCTVAPGFEFADFSLLTFADVARLCARLCPDKAEALRPYCLSAAG